MNASAAHRSIRGLACAAAVVACTRFEAAPPPPSGQRDAAAGQDSGPPVDTGRAPSFIGTGPMAASANAPINLTLPADVVAGDVLLAVFESKEETISIANAQGGTWTLVPGAPRGSGVVGSNNSSRITVFWSVHNGTQGAPSTNVVSSSGAGGIIASFRGADTRNPIDVTSVANGNAATTANTITIPGAATTTPDDLVVIVSTSEDDSDTFSPWTNASLLGMTDRFQKGYAQGYEGHIGMATGVSPLPGVYDNSTTSVGGGGASQRWGGMTIALRPPP